MGSARTHWTVPQTPGDHRLVARVDDAATATALEATALTTCVPLFVPPIVTIISGNGQTVLQHTVLPEPIVLQVRSGSGELGDGYWVTFSLLQSGEHPVVRTDANGIARWSGYVHEAGDIQVVASVEPSYGTSIALQLHVVPDGGLYDGRYSAAFVHPAYQEQRSLLSFSVRDGAVSEVSFGRGFSGGNHLVFSRVSEADESLEMIVEDGRGRRTYVEARLLFRDGRVAAAAQGRWAVGVWPSQTVPGNYGIFEAGRI